MFNIPGSQLFCGCKGLGVPMYIFLYSRKVFSSLFDFVVDDDLLS